jgi:hypothetical protein
VKDITWKGFIKAVLLVVENKILLIVEGAVAEEQLFKKLFKTYAPDERFVIVPYRTNIYQLYAAFEKYKDDEFDLLLALKERTRDEIEKELLSDIYSHIVIVFDLDNQDSSYEANKIEELILRYDNTTEAGKLFLNYPMVEAFWAGDEDNFDNQIVEVRKNKEFKKTYKDKWNAIDLISREALTDNIRRQLAKAEKIINAANLNCFPEQDRIFQVQAKSISEKNSVFTLCTCMDFMLDNYPDKIGVYV